MSEQRNVPATVERPETTAIPTLIQVAGGAARFTFEEFFLGQIRNPSKCKAYLHTIRLFSDWCGASGLELVRVTSTNVGRFLDSLPLNLPTWKLHLASLRRFFDGLVMRLF